MPGAHALHLAAINGDAETVEVLLARGVPADVASTGKETPLICAAFYGRLAAIELLLDGGAALEAKSEKYGWTPLEAAVANKQLASVKYLVSRGAEILGQHENGYTLLHAAAYRNSVEVAKFAIEHDVGIESATSKTLRRPVHIAAIQNATAVLALLAEHGANLEAQDSGGALPLQGAAYNGALGAVRLLVEKGALINAKGRLNATALTLARNRGHDKVVAYLKSKGGH